MSCDSFNPFANKPLFLCVCSTSLENIVERGEIAHNEQFLLFSQSALPLKELCAIFITLRIVFCKAFQIGRVLNLMSREVLTHYHTMTHFDTLKIYSCGKHCDKRRNCL